MTERRTSTNNDNGRAFEELASELLQNYYGKTFDARIPIPIGAPSKRHKFDCVSSDRTIAVECKCYEWTRDAGNVPSAKISTLNESLLYAHFLPKDTKGVIALKKATHPKRKETLAEYYFRTFRHVLGDIELLEIDIESKTVRPIKG